MSIYEDGNENIGTEVRQTFGYYLISEIVRQRMR